MTRLIKVIKTIVAIALLLLILNVVANQDIEYQEQRAASMGCK